MNYASGTIYIKNTHTVKSICHHFCEYKMLYLHKMLITLFWKKGICQLHKQYM